MNGKRIYGIAGGQCGRETLLAILREHPEIRFVSLVAIELASDRAKDLWRRIDALRHELADDTAGNPALCTRLTSALSKSALQEASKPQLVLADRIEHLQQLKDEYRKLVF
ncbi:MAG: hypothetical protein NT102_02305 [Caldiserica bacterium]|nr:hypothetical protein [Caldisericota bacterium]